MKHKMAFVVSFFLVCLLPAALMPFGVQSPNYEKRALAAPPRLLDANGVNLKFPQQFETYLADNFALRSYFVSVNAAANYYVLGNSANEKVIAGKDGWLFMADTLGDYQRATALSATELERLCRTLVLQQEYVLGRGAAFLFAVTPNKNSIYGQYMPDRYLRMEGPGAAGQLNAGLDAAGVAHADLHTALAKVSAVTQLYHKKDTHWNQYGAWLAYREIMRLLTQQVPSVPDVQGETAGYTLERQWRGDLETMLMPAFGLMDEQTVMARPAAFTAERPMRSPEDIDIVTKSGSNSLAVLMFRDSFTNALLPYFSHDFGRVHYTRAVPYDYSLMEKDNPDIVIVQIVERNMRDLLNRAPQIPAPQRHIGQPDFAPEPMSGEVFAQDVGNSLRISGWALPQGGQSGGRIYIELGNGQGSRVYEPFPVAWEPKDGKAAGGAHPQAMRDSGFEMLLGKDSLGKGTYLVSILLERENKWFRQEFTEITVN